MSSTGYASAPGGAALYYERHGAGVPILVIGGTGSTSASFSKIAPFVAEEFQFISYDRRSTGNSTGETDCGNYIDQQVHDLAALLDEMSIPEVGVFATCGGASIALSFATQYPSRLSFAVVHEPLSPHPLHDGKEQLEYYKSWCRRTETESPTNVLREFNTAHGLPFRDSFGMQLEDHGRFMFDCEVPAMLDHVPDVKGILQLGTRVSFATGRDSAANGYFFARSAFGYADLFKVQTSLYPGLHTAYYEQPEAFARELLVDLRKIAHDEDYQ